MDRTESEESSSNKVGGIEEFLNVLKKLTPSLEEDLYFRGHADEKFSLIPSVYRNKGWKKSEDILFKEMVLKCAAEFKDQDSTFQMLVKMQHYSLPTRLLDITANPLVALYFACAEKMETDGEVVVLKIPKQEIRYHDSDTVTILSNLSRRPIDFSIPESSDLKKFNENENIKKLLHEIKRDKPYFAPVINSKDIGLVVCVKPKQDNPRVIKQEGAFLLFGIKAKKKNCAEVNDAYLPWKKAIIIDKSKKEEIIQDLLALGVSKMSIYPEMDKVAEHLSDLYSDKPVALNRLIMNRVLSDRSIKQ